MESHSLTDLAAEHLGMARQAKNGRSADTLYGGSGHSLRQVLMALCAGQELAEHDSPGEATLLVVTGQVRLTVHAETSTPNNWEGTAGDLVAIPPARHGLVALTDAVVLLSVVKA
ncbi:MAG: cupin domain-containing protein [Propionibacteriales bacterium]|nr:cupin domain-containing protein [Propionibacteriales bacterium]